jgi:hypothetical protein
VRIEKNNRCLIDQDIKITLRNQKSTLFGDKVERACLVLIFFGIIAVLATSQAICKLDNQDGNF